MLKCIINNNTGLATTRIDAAWLRWLNNWGILSKIPCVDSTIPIDSDEDLIAGLSFAAEIVHETSGFLENFQPGLYWCRWWQYLSIYCKFCVNKMFAFPTHFFICRRHISFTTPYFLYQNYAFICTLLFFTNLPMLSMTPSIKLFLIRFKIFFSMNA